MDWDGIGTAAMFMASGAVGVGVILLQAYKAKLRSKLEWAKLARVEEMSGQDSEEHIKFLEEQVLRLTDRVDFNEKLLGDKRPDSHE